MDPHDLHRLQRLGDQITTFLNTIPIVESGASSYIGSNAPHVDRITVDTTVLREAARILSAAPYILR